MTTSLAGGRRTNLMVSIVLRMMKNVANAVVRSQAT
jgi:hypothetical protein